MAIYHCSFPGCNYSTEIRSQIHEHHIRPRELNGSNNKGNKILLCPNCHNKIYIPGSNIGIHSVEHKDSIILCNKLKSTSGYVLEYIENGENKYHFMRSL